MTLIGKLVKILYDSPEFSVFNFQEPRKAPVCATGNLGDLQPGETIELTGDWEKHPKYGTQFKVQVAVRPLPATAPAIEKFLSHSVKGCGPKMAQRIVSATGDQLDRILQEEPQMLLHIKGIKPEMLQKIQEVWSANSLEKQVSLFLAENLISLGWTHKVADHFGPGAVRTLTANPYRFIDIDGIGFLKADEIALRMGWKKDSAPRAEAILIHLMQESMGDGHVFLRHSELTARMRNSGVPEKVASTALDVMSKASKIKRVRGVDSKGVQVELIYLPRMLEYESGLASSISARLAGGDMLFSPVLTSMIEGAEKELGVQLMPPQREAVTNAFQRGMSIVTGPPGTGKSTLVKVLIRIARQTHRKVLLTAPTGRAAKNLANITNHAAETVHYLLEYSPKTGEWQRNRENPLEADIVVIEEGSMVDLEIAHRLFDAIPMSANVLIIGDDNQLPSVGPGRVLNDLIECGRIPVVRLQKVHRQAERSQIVRNSQRILRGEFPVFPPADTDGHPTDCHLMKPPENITGAPERAEWARHTLVDVVKRRIPARYQVDPIQDIQVIAPMRKGSLGINELNVLLQEALNPPAADKQDVHLFGHLFRTGDRVMFIKNNKETGARNGETGILKHIDFKERKLTIDNSDTDIKIEFDNANQISLAFAITCHKSQGGEYPIVIALFFSQHFQMLQRNLLYTAMTRAKQRLVFLATNQALEMAVNNSEIANRNTMLAVRIRMLAKRKAA